MKKVLITGASRGLGLELTRIFRDNRYQLVLHARENELPEIDGATYFYGDFGNRNSINELFEKIYDQSIDIFINNAAYYQNKPFGEVSVDELDYILTTDMVVPALLIKKLWPLSLLVNINSLAGKNGSYGEAGYCASKFGLRGLSESLDRDVTEAGGRVIDVYLGAMNTDMTKQRPDQDKLIDPKEAAETIFELCKARNTLQIREAVIKRTKY